MSGHGQVTRIQSKQQYKLTCDLLHSVRQTNYLLLLIYALAHFTKLKPTIEPVKCHYIKTEEITQFHQRIEIG